MDISKLSFEDWANISTTLGVVISTITLWSAYQLYKLSKRDSYIKEIRNVLISYRYNSNSLNNLINYDISHELTHQVIYSSHLDRVFNKIHADFFIGNKTKKELKK